MEQAAAYIVENQSSFKTYLTSYQKQRLKLLEKQVPALGNTQAQQKRTVATTWAMNFADIEKNFPASADLLRVSAFLAPDAIPLELLERAGNEMGGRLALILSGVKNDPLVVDELLKPLVSYSLIRRNPESRTYSIHPLVQDVIRDGMALGKEQSWARCVVQAVSASLPAVEFQNWQDYDRLISHSLNCADLIAQFNFEFAAAAHLLNQAGYYLNRRARYTEAEPLYHRALAIREKVLGADHPDTGISLNNLAELYRHQGKYNELEPLYRRCLEIWEKALGPEHENTGRVLNNLALLYYHQARYDEAEPLNRRSLAIWEKVLGPEHPQTATALNNLAELYRTLGKYREAEPLYLRSLAINEKVHGAGHPDTAMVLDNLGALYYLNEKYEEAERLHSRALAIREKALGLQHPNTAASLNNLGFLRYAQGRHSEAEPLYRRALEICQKVLGSQHPDTITLTKNLISCYRKQGKLKEAKELEQQLNKSS